MPSDDQKLFARYLLGSLSTEEEAQVEDRAFADAGYRVELEAAEADLIDAYVRGELSSAERRAFEHRFLTSTQRRSKVEFARSLVKIADESKAVEIAPSKSPSAWLSWIGLGQRWSPALQFAASLAVLIALAGASWLVIENRAVRSRISALETERRDFEAREAALRRQVSEQENRAATLAEEIRKRPSPTVPAVASLVLLPGLSRAETSRAQLAVNPLEQLARIEILVEARDDYPRFTTELRTRRGEEVLIRSNLSRGRTAAGYVVSFDVPTSALNASEYELALKGVTSDGRTQDVGYY